MGLIAVEDFIYITDNLAKQYQLMEETLGDKDTEDTVIYGAYKNVLRAMSLEDAIQEIDLLKSLHNVYLSLSVTSFFTPKYSPIICALDNHINSNGSGTVNTYCSQKGIRVSPEFAEMYKANAGIQIDAKNVFSPEIDNMATFVWTGEGTGTFIDGDEIDISKYSSQQLKVKCLTDFAISATATIVCVTDEDIEEENEIEIPAGTTEGTEFLISENKYYDIKNIEVSGGVNGNKIKVFAPREREATF